MIHFPWVQKNFISIRNINSSSSHFPFIKFRDPNLQFQPFGFSNFVLLERTRSYANCSKVRINGMDSNIKDLHGQMVANYAFFLPYIKGEANSYFAFPTQAGTSSFTHSLCLCTFTINIGPTPLWTMLRCSRSSTSISALLSSNRRSGATLLAALSEVYCRLGFGILIFGF